MFYLRPLYLTCAYRSISRNGHLFYLGCLVSLIAYSMLEYLPVHCLSMHCCLVFFVQCKKNRL